MILKKGVLHVRFLGNCESGVADVLIPFTNLPLYPVGTTLIVSDDKFEDFYDFEIERYTHNSGNGGAVSVWCKSAGLWKPESLLDFGKRDSSELVLTDPIDFTIKG